MMNLLGWVGVLGLFLPLSGIRSQEVGDERWRLYRGEAGLVTATLSAERSMYYVGEPVELVLAVRNESDYPLAGFFAATSGRAQVQWRRESTAFTPFMGASKDQQAWAERRHGLQAPVALKPAEEWRSQLKLAAHGTGRLVLEEVGKYQFRVILRAAPKEPDRVLESNVLSVQVEPVPGTQRDAFAEYSRRQLGAVVQSAWWAAERSPAALKSAAEFLDRYPDSPYSQALRRELARVLRTRVLQNRARDEERALYEKLREAESPNQ